MDIDFILHTIEERQKALKNIENDIENFLIPLLDEECRKVIFEKYKEGQFITHREKYVFKLGDTNSIRGGHVNVDSFVNIEHKSFSANANKIPICRAVSLIDNARLSTEEEINDYNICKKMAQCKALGI